MPVHKEKLIEVLKCWDKKCEAVPPKNISGGNRYRWMHLHMSEHFKRGELLVTSGVDVRKELLYTKEALELTMDAVKELHAKLEISTQ